MFLKQYGKLLWGTRVLHWSSDLRQVASPLSSSWARDNAQGLLLSHAVRSVDERCFTEIITLFTENLMSYFQTFFHVSANGFRSTGTGKPNMCSRLLQLFTANLSWKPDIFKVSLLKGFWISDTLSAYSVSYSCPWLVVPFFFFPFPPSLAETQSLNYSILSNQANMA